MGRESAGRGTGHTRSAERLHRCPGAQAGGAQPGSGHRSAGSGAAVLPYPGGGRSARRVAERPRVSGRGDARRDGPGPARPGDGTAAIRHRRPHRGHRRGCPRAGHRPADPRDQLRRPGGSGVLHPPDRKGGTRRPRGRGRHPGRTPTTSDAQGDRADDQAADRHREGPDDR